MEDMRRVRFLAANYPSLQGLKYVPQGLLAILISLWGNSQRKPATDLTLPILFVALCSALYLLLDRYYSNAFGRVQPTATQRRVEWLSSIAGVILALAAFAVDTSQKLPVSTLGLVLSAVFLVDYFRITRFAQDRFLLYYPVMAAVMILISISPIIGPADWWRSIGINHPVLGVLMISGLLIVTTGFLIHLSLVRNLPPKQEAINGEHS